MPRSPVRTPITRVPVRTEHVLPGKPQNRSMPSASTCSASHFVNVLSEMM